MHFRQQRFNNLLTISAKLKISVCQKSRKGVEKEKTKIDQSTRKKLPKLKYDYKYKHC